MKKTLLILITLCITTIGYSQIFTDNFITYEVITSTTNVEITDYNMAGGTVVNIPATVTNAAITYSVTNIGNSAFSSKGLTAVTIPNTVIIMGNSAFQSNNLTNVTIPDSVIIMGLLCFLNNTLTSVTLSNNITTIRTATFQGNAITDITIPDGVTSIQLNAFLNNELTNITIPSNVIIIGQRAFRGNPLNSVTSLSTTPPSVFRDIVNDSFDLNRSNVDLYVPVGSLSTYTALFTWGGFNSVTEGTLSTSNFELANDITVITTTDAIKIVFSNSVRLQNYTIYNISGAKVATGKESNIATTSFATGIYILKLDFDKGVFTKKVVVN